MKFLFVGTDQGKGGAHMHFLALAGALQQAGHAISAVAAPGRAVARGMRALGVPVVHGRFRNPFDPRGYLATRAVIGRFSPDWIVGGFGRDYWPLIIVSRAFGTPVALFRHINRRMKRFSEWCVPRLADRFITVSKFARGMYVDAGVSPLRVRVSHNPIDTHRFTPDPAAGMALRQQLRIGANVPVMGFVGRITDGKGVFPLLEAANQAMARRPDLHVLWVGDGPEWQALQECCQAGGRADQHHFIGWMDDLVTCYNAMSFMAFPSIEPETFGRVSAEAQACGIPVLGSRIGGIPESLQDGRTGRLLEPGNVPAWRDAIIELCDDRVRATLSANARAFAIRHFSYRVVAEEFVTMLQASA